MNSLPAIDYRPRARLWDRAWHCLAEERVPDGEKPITIVERLLRDSGRMEAHATVDWPDSGSRVSGYVYLDAGVFKLIDHDEVTDLTRWPEMSKLGRP